MLRLDNIAKRIGDFSLRHVTLDVDEGEYFVLLGASGVGKSMILEMIAGLVSPDCGRVLLDDVDITAEKVQRRRIALVFQDQVLFPHMTVRKNIAYCAAKGDDVGRLAERVGVEQLLDRRPETLSGGEAQRVALARALATGPRCLLLDEPLSSLDSRARLELRALLRRLNREGQTVIHVTHDFEEAVALATRIGVLEEGSVVQVGTPDEVLRHPASEFAARFIGIRNVWSGELLANGADLMRFAIGSVSFAVLSGSGPGPGFVTVRSEDVTVANERTVTSALNTFEGAITDVAQARLGYEVTVDIGVDVTALVTEKSITRLGLEHGKKVWVSFKASAARFIQA